MGLFLSLLQDIEPADMYAVFTLRLKSEYRSIGLRYGYLYSGLQG